MDGGNKFDLSQPPIPVNPYSYKRIGIDPDHRTNRNRNKTRVNVRILVLVPAVLLLVGNTIASPVEANAQFPSLFPPPPPSSESGDTTDDDVVITSNDKIPPEVEVITTELKQGKNVLIVKVTDDSFLKSRQVKYVNEGKIKFADLARDHDNVYHALINVDPPSSIVVFDIIDAAGNRATITKEMPVIERSQPDDFLDTLADVWKNILVFVGFG